MLNKKSLQIIQALFSDQSTVSIPAAYAEQVLEIRTWVQEELKKDAPVT